MFFFFCFFYKIDSRVGLCGFLTPSRHTIHTNVLSTVRTYFVKKRLTTTAVFGVLSFSPPFVFVGIFFIFHFFPSLVFSRSLSLFLSPFFALHKISCCFLFLSHHIIGDEDCYCFASIHQFYLLYPHHHHHWIVVSE
jgi:hypothetical protein